MEFVKSILKVTIYGEPQELRFPTLLEIKNFSKSKKDEIDNTIDFLDRLGLAKKVSENMEVLHLKKIMEALMAEKKS